MVWNKKPLMQRNGRNVFAEDLSATVDWNQLERGPNDWGIWPHAHPVNKYDRSYFCKSRERTHCFSADNFLSLVLFQFCSAYLFVYENEPRSGKINYDKLHGGGTQTGRRVLFVQQVWVASRWGRKQAESTLAECSRRCLSRRDSRRPSGHAAKKWRWRKVLFIPQHCRVERRIGQKVLIGFLEHQLQITDFF